MEASTAEQAAPDEPVIDSTAEEIEPQIGHALIHRPVTHEVLRPLDVADQKAAMQTYQEGLRTILDSTDWQDAGRGESFVKKSGWRKIAAWFNLSIELVADEVERNDDGQVQRAKVWARAVAPNGRFADGDGYCDVTESRFNRNKSKLENDLRGTATTRAVNRAISNLVGMGAVSAEEVDGGASGPPLGPAASDDQVGLLSRALVWALDGADPAEAAFNAVKVKCGGYVPAAVADSIVLVIKAQRDLNDGGTTPAEQTDDNDNTKEA